MSEPLDFSTIGKADRPTVSKPAARRLPGGPGWSGSRRPLVLAAAAATAVVVALLVFGRGSDEVDGAALTRYCSLATEFDQLLIEGTEVAAIGQFLQSMGNGVDQMKRVAPKAIRADVAASVDAARDAAAGNSTDLQSAEQQARLQRIAAFRQQACSGSDPGNS